jgi:hypothetical protein
MIAKMTGSAKLRFLVLLFGVTYRGAAGGSIGENVSTVDEFWKFPACEMKCANGGYCSLVERTTDELARMAQSGKLISSCVCKPGFAGVACENLDQDCILPEKKCSNGFPCRAIKTDSNGTTEWSCDCALADSLSDFAGKMCRNPLTEYCNGKFDPHAPMAFCTNGGRCRGDFLGAQVDPGNTTVNSFYQDAGCICPRDFYGPHCEFLRLNVVDDVDNNFDSNDDTEKATPITSSSDHRNPIAPVLTAIFVLLSASLVITAVVLHIRQQGLPPVRRVQFRGHGDNISIMSTTTLNHGQYLGNIQFLDEGILTQQELDTVFETVELS